jgi:hypothetical protein
LGLFPHAFEETSMSTVTPRISRAICILAATSGCLLAACSSSSMPSMSTSGPPACTSSGKNAYDTYGAAAFLTVNDAIFKNVGAEIAKNGEKNLGGSFGLVGKGTPPSTSDDPTTFQGVLGAFLVYAYGGPSSTTVAGKSYDAKAVDLEGAHTGLNITADQYTYFITSIVVPALTSSGVKSEDVSSCFAPVVMSSSVMDAVIGH